MIVFGELGAFVRATGKWSNPFELSVKTWLFLVLLVTGVSRVCCFRAQKIGDASGVAPVDKVSVLLVTVFALTFHGERPSLRKWIGILVVGAGVFVLACKKQVSKSGRLLGRPWRTAADGRPLPPSHPFHIPSR